MSGEWLLLTILWVLSLCIMSSSFYYRGYKKGSQTILNSWKAWLTSDEDEE